MTHGLHMFFVGQAIHLHHVNGFHTKLFPTHAVLVMTGAAAKDSGVKCYFDSPLNSPPR